MTTLQIKLVYPEAKIPTRHTPEAAGLDLYSIQNQTVKANNKAIIDTGIAVVFPPETYGRIAPRSTSSYANHFVVGGGVIDPDFRGTIKVILFNLGSEDFQILKGESHAQLVIEKIAMPKIEVVTELAATSRMFTTGIDRYYLSEMLWKNTTWCGDQFREIDE